MGRGIEIDLIDDLIGTGEQRLPRRIDHGGVVADTYDDLSERPASATKVSEKGESHVYTALRRDLFGRCRRIRSGLAGWQAYRIDLSRRSRPIRVGPFLSASSRLEWRTFVIARCREVARRLEEAHHFQEACHSGPPVAAPISLQ